MKRLIITALLVLVTSFASYSLTFEEFLYSRSINVGFAFLKTSPDPVSFSLCDAGTAGYSSASNFLVNPASPSFLREKSLIFNYRYSLSALNISFVSMQFGLLGGELGLSTGYSASDTIPLRNELPTSEHLGLYRFQSFSATISYSRELIGGIYAGLSGRSITETSYDLSKTAFTANAGLLMEFEAVKGFSAGLSLLNIGSRVRYDETDADYIIPPFTLRIGVREEWVFSPIFTNSSYLDFIKVNDQEFRVALADEMLFLGDFLVRLGYVYNDPVRFFSAGIGMKTERFRIDYAVSPYMYNLGIDNSISLTYKF